MTAAYGNVIRRPAPTVATSPLCRTNLVMGEAFKTVQLSGKTVMEGDCVVSVKITSARGGADGGTSAFVAAITSITAAGGGTSVQITAAAAAAAAATFKDSFCRRRSAVEPLICNIALTRTNALHFPQTIFHSSVECRLVMEKCILAFTTRVWRILKFQNSCPKGCLVGMFSGFSWQNHYAALVFLTS